jgi:hypothetical protein
MRRAATLSLLYMLHPLSEQGNDVIVFDAVMDFLAVPPGYHQTHLAQAAQVVRDSRLADPYGLRQSTDVHFLLYQDRQDPHPAGIAEGAEKFCNVRSGMFI